MYKKIKNIDFFNSRIISGLSVRIISNTEFVYSLIILNKTKKGIVVENKYSEITEANKILSYIPKNSPIIVDIDGKGVLNKILDNIEDENDKTILTSILPNAEINDFYISKIILQEKKALASIIRKTLADKIINEININNNFVIDLFIGPFKIISILNLLENKELLNFENYSIKIENNTIYKLEQIEKNNNIPRIFKIENEEVFEYNLVGFSSALSYFTNNTDGKCNLSNLNKQKEEVFFKNVFSYTGWFILAFLLSILLVNFLFFDYYNKENNKLSISVEQNKDLLKRIETLNAEIKFKEDFIKNNNFISQTKYSYYSDRIAYLLPKDIVLTSISFQDLKKKMKEGKEPTFFINIVRVEGKTKTSRILNNWIKELRKEDWINDIEIISYTRSSIKSIGEFEIEIKID